MNQTSSKKTPIVLLTLALSGAIAYTTIDTGSAVSVADVYTVSGTITQSRTGCSHSERAEVVAVYVDGNFVELTARTADGAVVVASKDAAVARAPDNWCGVFASAPTPAVAASCTGDSLSFSLGVGGVTWSFASDAGDCAFGVNVVQSTNRSPVLPVTVELIGNPVPAACLAVVQLRIGSPDVATLVPAYAPGDCANADQADFCATFDGKPGVLSCVLQTFPAKQQLFKPGPAVVAQACLYTTPLGIDITGDNVSEFSVPVAGVQSTPC